MLINNQQDIPYIVRPKREGMPFSGKIKLKLNFFKSMQNKITKSIFNFPFILEYFFLIKKKRLNDTKTV